jgi:DNA-binding MarR family transcriptional regulator
MPSEPGKFTDDDPSLTQLVMRTARKLRRATLGELEPFGLTPSQSRAVGVISRHGSAALRLGDLAAHLDIAPRSATEVVDGLEELGLVRRSPDPTDRRAVTIALTDEGRALRRRIDQARARRGDEFFGHLSEDQQAQLRDLLERAIAPHDRLRDKPSPP